VNRPVAVFNEASPRRIIRTAGWWGIFLTISLPVGIAASTGAQDAWSRLTVMAVTIGPWTAVLVYIFVGGKTVTVVEDGLVIERWASRCWTLGFEHRLRWGDIERAEYVNRSTRRGVWTWLIVRTTAGGRSLFLDLSFDTRELHQLMALLRERLGNDKVAERHERVGRRR
jgi:hypothetical protein